MIPSVVKKWSRRQQGSRGGLEDLYDHSIKADFQYAILHTPCPVRCCALDRAVTMATAVSGSRLAGIFHSLKRPD
jgi:hypothetical protein